MKSTASNVAPTVEIRTLLGCGGHHFVGQIRDKVSLVRDEASDNDNYRKTFPNERK